MAVSSGDLLLPSTSDSAVMLGQWQPESRGISKLDITGAAISWVKRLLAAFFINKFNSPHNEHRTKVEKILLLQNSNGVVVLGVNESHTGGVPDAVLLGIVNGENNGH
ncbi:hypothetical protein SDJN02_20620 [Cucurbita argyrosperma subsp. argyrosperma]|nr:hypothetical protein SDJN02_20620 [Cucurbita argyrosperma subsp. argyrosperma]